MRQLKFLFLLAPLMCTAARAQTNTAPAAPYTLRTSTQLVVVDVTVHDGQGKPVRGLSRQDFALRENGAATPLRFFEERTAVPATGQHGAVLPTVARNLPPGVFTDLAVPPSGPLNVLLLDSLNTPLASQAFLRQQLLEFVRQLQPGSNTAIFGLASRLYQLQGFTTDPAVLRRALGSAAPSPSTQLSVAADSNLSAPSGSEVMADSAGAPPPTPGSPPPSQIQAAAAVFAQFEADTEAAQTQIRIEDTVDGFNAVAHYLANFPGRKNLLWFSGSFPLTLLPDPTAGSQPVSTFFNNELLKQTTALLSKAQVAVYPIDVRGLLVNPAFEASRPGAHYADPAAFGRETLTFQAGLAQEHHTEMIVAEESGGHAFYNTNSLAAAAAAAVEDGSNYYVLEYQPVSRHDDGDYHKISVNLTGAAEARGYTLSYRRGYYNDSQKNLEASFKSAGTRASEPLRTPQDLYARTAMSRGGPTPSEVLFTASVLPVSAAPEAALAEGVKASPEHAPKPPFRRLRITFALLPSALQLLQQADGSHTGALSFLAFVYDEQGNLTLSSGRQISLNIGAEKFQNFTATPIRYALDIDVPEKGESILRIGVHDLAANHFGVIEVSASSLPANPPPAAKGLDEAPVK